MTDKTNKILSDEEIDAIPINEDGEPHGASETVKQWDRNLCQAQAAFTASQKDTEIEVLKAEKGQKQTCIDDLKRQLKEQEAKIKEMEATFQTQEEQINCLISASIDHEIELEQAKANARKEIGEWLETWHENCDDKQSWHKLVTLIAKLQKGKLEE